jgi:hypothetical protein
MLYVAVYSAHVNVGFFQGATLDDPHGLLQGSGKLMRHVKLHPGSAINRAAPDPYPTRFAHRDGADFGPVQEARSVQCGHIVRDAKKVSLAT